MTPEEIKAIRLKYGVSQEKFAYLLGTTIVTVNRWENGKVKPSRLYIRELKEIRDNFGLYVCRRKKLD
jgi:putative transcriptional regulator